MRLDMSVRLMICPFVLERCLFDMCRWGRVERNVRGQFFSLDFGSFFGRKFEQGMNRRIRYFGCGISREILIRKRSRLLFFYCYGIFSLI